MQLISMIVLWPTSQPAYLCGRRRLLRFHDHRHLLDGPGHPSSRDPDRQGYGSDHGPSYRSLSHGDRPCVESSPGGEVE